MNDQEIFDVFLHNWEDSPGDDEYIRKGMMQFVDHPQKEELTNWFIDNYSGQVRFVGGGVEYDSSFKNEFNNFMKELN